MSMVGTFDSFTTARLGIYAAQHGLRVTGNNISNINTAGYTRQRVDQVSLKSGGADMYRSPYDNHVGNGALVTGINQIRDPYLDIQYRNTASKVGYTDTWLSGLRDIAQTLDEVGKGDDTNRNEEGDGILNSQLQDLRDMLMQLHNDPTKANDTLVRNSAETLCQLFNTYAKNLETLRKETDADFNNELKNVNQILSDIRDLNESIRNAEIVGDNALELRDERNRQIDSLAEYMSIKVEYVMEDIGGGKEVEKLIISLGNANPDADVHSDETRLIDGIYSAKLLYPEEIDGKKNDRYTLQVSNMVDSKNRLPKNHNEVNAGRPITLEDNDLYGAFQAMRELLTEKGEFSTQDDIDADPDAATKRGIPYYQMSLDLLARKFAETYNSLNQGVMVDQNDNVLYEEVEAAGKTPEELGLKELEANDPGVEGYYVDQFGYYTGQHGTNCFMLEAQLNANDTLVESMKKIGAIDKLDDVSNQKWSDKVREVLNDKGEIIEGKEADAQAILKSFLSGHAVSKDNGALEGPDADGKVTFAADVDKVLTPKTMEGSGLLFSNRNDRDSEGTDGDDNDPRITAANISVAHSWSTGDVKVIPTFKELYGGDIKDSTQNTNIDHMISMIGNATIVYNPQDLDPDAMSTKLFTGTFNGMFNNMGTTLGNDERTLGVQVNTHYAQLVDIDTSRDGVSGVDLNDEAMNIMMYQKAYSAACRLMTAIDEAIDRLINNTGIAGR